MLLLPTHWCCAFPVAAAEAEAAPVESSRSCCKRADTSPEKVKPFAERTCCQARAMASETNCHATSHSAPGDAARCACCESKVVAEQKPTVPPDDEFRLPAFGGCVTPRELGGSREFVRYGASIPISGSTLALFCRWNC